MKNKMKISIINGSSRSSGATAKILKEVERHLIKKGDVQVDFINVAKLKGKFCKGCIECYKLGECIIKDDPLEEVIGEVKQSDGIVIGSPTYGSNISGYLKNFMDRGHFLVDQSLHNRYGFAIATYEIADGGVALKIIKKFIAVSGAILRGVYLHRLDFNTDPMSDHRKLKRLYKQTDRFYMSIKNKAQKNIWEKLFSYILVQVIWKPIFLSQPKKYEATLTNLKDKHILSTEKTSFLSPIINALL
jgi:multimeric flavodoxin WrbA